MMKFKIVSQLEILKKLLQFKVLKILLRFKILKILAELSSFENSVSNDIFEKC